jgi:hypothetical protein
VLTCLRPRGGELLLPLRRMPLTPRPRPLGIVPGLAGTGVEGSALPLATLKIWTLPLRLASRPLIPVPGWNGTGSGSVVAPRLPLLGSLLRPQSRWLPAPHTLQFLRKRLSKVFRANPLRNTGSLSPILGKMTTWERLWPCLAGPLGAVRPQRCLLQLSGAAWPLAWGSMSKCPHISRPILW